MTTKIGQLAIDDVYMSEPTLQVQVQTELSSEHVTLKINRMFFCGFFRYQWYFVAWDYEFLNFQSLVTIFNRFL